MPASSIAGRLRKLQQRMLDIRCGTGAMILPKSVKRIHLRFAPKINNVQMTVEHNAPQEEKPILSIHFTEAPTQQSDAGEASESSTTDSNAPASRVETIDCQNKTNAIILQELVALTNPTLLETSPQDEALREELARQFDLNEQGRKQAVERAAEVKRQENMIKQARDML
ncbi:hypothetical protein MRB53_039507 [Persea americana]|nr:hypothetical protein MRB53_039507 [Persea americana]